MKKVFSGAGHIILAVFTVIIVAFMAVMNYQTLGRVFPNDPMQQIWGMALFTGGTLSWFTIFLLASRGFQRPIAMVMFGISLAGEVFYSAADVLMGGQSWVTVSPSLGTYVIYSFIGLTFAHGLALYIHFFAKPEVMATIDTEALEDDVKAKAQERATELINARVEGMAEQLAMRVADTVFVNLRLPMPAVIDGVVLSESQPKSDLRPAQVATNEAKDAGWFEKLFGKISSQPVSDLDLMTGEDAKALVKMWRENRNRGINIPDFYYADQSSSTPTAYTIDKLLEKMGMSDSYAREYLTKHGWDADADKAFDEMMPVGYLPLDLSRDDFRRLHHELFSTAPEASAVDAQFREPKTENLA